MNCTLSRSHKIVERITREIDANANAARELAAPVVIHVPEAAADASQVKSQVEVLLAKNLSLYWALGRVRGQISATNDSIGIGSLLTQKNVLIRQKRQNDDLISYLRSSASQTIESEHVGAYFNQMSLAGEMRSVRVAVLGKKSIEELELASKELQRKLDNISDQINTLNAKTQVQIGMPEEIWALFS